ncbi:Hemerythrin HHE cation binding protein [human gut metagenome]|uniref:Hemerythrin HHE cation binding protein n=1 Tax=human gut metagenome TaxID=408170 RepID=W1X599_9ZZZZ
MNQNMQKKNQLIDIDPRPLHYQFIMELPETFEWEYLEEGPEVWRVAITKK